MNIEAATAGIRRAQADLTTAIGALENAIRELEVVIQPEPRFYFEDDDTPAGVWSNETICARCGQRFGLHVGDRCPINDTRFAARIPSALNPVDVLKADDMNR